MGPHASRQRKRRALQSKNIAGWCREMQAMCSSHPTTTIIGHPAAAAATRNVPSLVPFAGGLWRDS